MNTLNKLSVVIPARNEEGCIASTVEHLHLELRLQKVPHEIVVVDDGSTDQTWEVLQKVAGETPEVKPVSNPGPHGFGRAIQYGLQHYTGDAVVIMMADESDDCRDVVVYWEKLKEGYECVFGSRFIKGGGVIDYPTIKWMLNRMANLFIKMVFRIKLNDTTNAFKAYRREVIDGCRPLLAPHFNLTVELPLKAIVRGYTWTIIPITWRNRRTGLAKLKIREMGSRYFFITMYVWLEKYFSRGDYRRQIESDFHSTAHASDDPDLRPSGDTPAFSSDEQPDAELPSEKQDDGDRATRGLRSILTEVEAKETAD
ncbi:glycosyltransferase family 2 protein [Blastopirellula marina]|uniref:Putative polyprenol phosphate mannosyl transferase 1 (Ppm1) n=1 Tax=Blastopirellula marina DSM 3645 TaxID=314230 RepID=A3ZS78_9BACT|nr:glycosyltransferase family 2 protein [Blastopirellula marina]EAQ80536.1 putative polyprenol phosphate mannosyl transferase 1 (Ppm1) [Blastopirellula marina DSM 3645]